MSSGSWNRVDVGCPFYHRDDCHRAIVCEGIVPDTEARMKFGSTQERKRRMEIFCCGCYEKCEQYIALMSKYDEEE